MNRVDGTMARMSRGITRAAAHLVKPGHQPHPHYPTPCRFLEPACLSREMRHL